MAPEEPHRLVALWLDMESGSLTCRGAKVYPRGPKLEVSWYAATQSASESYISVFDGAVFVKRDSIAGEPEVSRFCPTKIDNRYLWRDRAAADGLMVVLVLPSGRTLDTWDPVPVEAKQIAGRVAVFWLLYPTSDAESSVTSTWSLRESARDLEIEVERLNRTFFLTRRRETSTDYDVALSFAGEDREYVEGVATALEDAGVGVFYDKLKESEVWGQNLYTYLSNVYQNRARFTVMFISQWYAEKRWTTLEREAAQARALTESKGYILPARFDDTEVPGMLATIGYISLQELTPTEFARLILRKLESNAV
jgi:TIR domain